MKLESGNIILREWTEADAERLAEIANNKKIFDNLRDAFPLARNIGSRRSLEKTGFRLEAELRCNVIKNGIIEDSCIYAILKDDFINMRV